jgi:hypothetical protein
VTAFPPRPAFSSLSFATTRAGTGALPLRELHRQWSAGQPQPGHTRPAPDEYTNRENSRAATA